MDDPEIIELCIFLGLKDSLKYYYIQLANKTEANLNGIFLVKNTSAIKLTPENINPLVWGENKWHKVRIERNIVRRTIVVFFDDMTIPLMEVKNYELVMGYIGFGSFNTSGRIDNIKIWSQTVLPDETKIFNESGMK
jgi:hypothetical protein